MYSFDDNWLLYLKEEESENENMPHNATSKKEWGEPPANIDTHEEHMDKSEKEDIITESSHQKNKPVNGNGVVNSLATTNADISHLPEVSSRFHSLWSK